jgi:ATP phosphoribosyltransferase regulatory subunit
MSPTPLDAAAAPGGPDALDGLALPRGARDLLPTAARRRARLTQALLASLDRWGYDPVVTPAIEYFSVFGRWLTERDRQRCVRFIEAGTGELVTLRSDITPQIARLSALQLGERLAAGEALRLCYAAEVVRLGADTSGQVQHPQVGAELLGDDGPEADAELILACGEALRAAGLPHPTLELADVGIARGVFDRLPAGCDTEALHDLLARKDSDGVAHFAAALPIRPEARDGLRLLCELFGGADVLKKVPTDVRAAWPWLDHALRRLETVVELCERVDADLVARLVIDLGEVRGHDYYTGLRLRAWAPGVAAPLVRGGRYRGGAGFAVELEALEAAIDHAGVATEPRRGGVVVVAEDASVRARAIALAWSLRQAGERAWTQVGLGLEGAQRASGEAGRLIHLAAGGTVSSWLRGPDDGWQSAEENEPK